ncbi:hypothetical protein [Selenomonas ruminantium]|nr:hypothetical protein [Selenomonas ruminantium]
MGKMAGKRTYLEKLYDETLWGAAWFSWYDFPERDSVLVAGCVSSAALEELSRRFLSVRQYDPDKSYEGCMFSAILVGGSLGSRVDNTAFLNSVKHSLSAHGILLWAADNKLGTRFLCGDDHWNDEGEYFTRQEWEHMFLSAGLPVSRVYGLMPGWHLLRNVFSDDCPLTGDTMQRLELRYVTPENLFRDETELLHDILDNQCFSYMVNAFLLEYRQEKAESAVLYADMYGDKDRESASVIQRLTDGMVVKKPLYIGGSVAAIYHHGEILRKRGLSVVVQQYDGENIIMPYMEVPLLSQVMEQTAKRSETEFRRLLERYWQCILNSSDEAEINDFPHTNQDVGKILQKAYVDMIPTNVFVSGDKLVFFDQEYCYENYPARFVLYRGLGTLYSACPDLKKFVSLETVKEWFGITEIWPVFQVADREHFVCRARNMELYGEYHEKHCRNARFINRNRQLLSRIDKLACEDLFADIKGKKIVLFGAGRFCDRYLQEFGNIYSPDFIVDNDSEKWHKRKKSVEILSPDVLKTMNPNFLRIIVCCHSVDSIGRQLKSLGIEDYRVY